MILFVAGVSAFSSFECEQLSPYAIVALFVGGFFTKNVFREIQCNKKTRKSIIHRKIFIQLSFEQLPKAIKSKNSSNPSFNLLHNLIEKLTPS